MALFLFAVLIVLLLLGLPIAFSAALAALLAFYVYDFASLTTVAHYMYGALNNLTLIALPLFILVGTIMGRGGLVRYIFAFANSILKNVQGGLGTAVVITSAIFAAISGSSLANAAALGMILLPALVAYKYPRDFSSGLIAVGGTLGILIPPSLTMILYGAITEQSVGKLFMAGMIPGIIAIVVLAIFTYFFAGKKGVKVEKTPLSAQEIGSTFKKGFPILLAPVIILGGIYGGVFTPDESAAVAAVYCLLITLFYYRTIKPGEVLAVFSESAATSAMIMVIVSGVMLFGYVITVSQLPQKILEVVVGVGFSAVTFLMILNLLLIIMGCFLDVFSIMLITLPILYPVLIKLGIDPIHLAVIYTVNMEIGTITPPVGMNLFALSGATQVPVEEVVRGSWPFVIAMIGILLLVTYVPVLSTWLPSFMK